jgi:hypothetical protein
LLIKRGNQFIPIEIKSSKTFHPSFLKGLNHFQALVGSRCESGFLIYAGDREQCIHNVFVKHFSKVKEISAMFHEA